MNIAISKLQTTVLMLAALGVVTFLDYTGHMGEQAVSAVVTAIVAFAAGTSSHALGVSQGQNGSKQPPPPSS